MIDTKGFIKLFGLNIPTIDHFDYYIDQLSKTRKFRDIKNMISLYEESEREVSDLFSFRLSKSKEIIDFLKNSNSWSELCYDSKNLIDYPTSKSIKYEDGKYYLSIDIKQANWLSLKKYDDPSINELGNTYQDLLLKFNMPKIFIHSKYLRQYIFGDIDPKRISRVQRNMIQEIVREYDSQLNVEFVRNDEVIFTFDSFDEISFTEKLDINRYNIKVFSVNRVEDFRVDSIYDTFGNFIEKEMSMVDGTRFYFFLKKYITGEKLDIRDFYFRNNDRLAIWCDDLLDIKMK